MPIEFMQESQPTGSSDNSLFRLTMAYDGSGRRISKTRWVKKLGSQEWEKELVTHYTGIGTEVREDFSKNQTKVVVNMPEGLGRYGIEDAEKPDFGGRTGDQLAGYIPNTKFEWYLKNHLGSTMLVYGTEGNATSDPFRVSAPLAAYDYRAFGEMVELTPPPTGKVTENFTGKEHDDEIALDYFGARYLDPMLGMWISVDPKRQFASPYLYAGNGMNPVNVMDPDGNVTIGIAFHVSGATPTLVSASAGATYSIMVDFDRILSGKWGLLYAVSGEVGGGVGGGGGASVDMFVSSDSPKLGAYEQRRYDVNIIAGGGVGISLSPGDGGSYDASVSIGGGAEAYAGGSIEFGYIGELHPDNKLPDMIDNPTGYTE